MTAEQLWNDKNFILKRIEQQNAYIDDLHKVRGNTVDDRSRILELRDSAMLIKERFVARYLELTGNTYVYEVPA